MKLLRKRSIRIQTWLAIVLATALAACTAQPAAPTLTPTPAAPTSAPATAIPSPTRLEPSPIPSATPPPSETPAPTATPIPPTRTPFPPTATPGELNLELPSGTPLSDWKGIPVMPGAEAGEEDQGNYTFITRASPDEVIAYYIDTMPGLGWQVLGSNSAGDPNRIVFLQKDQRSASVAAVVQGEYTWVLIVVTE